MPDDARRLAEQIVKLHNVVPCRHCNSGACQACQIAEIADALRIYGEQQYREGEEGMREKITRLIKG